MTRQFAFVGLERGVHNVGCVGINLRDDRCAAHRVFERLAHRAERGSEHRGAAAGKRGANPARLPRLILRKDCGDLIGELVVELRGPLKHAASQVGFFPRFVDRTSEVKRRVVGPGEGGVDFALLELAEALEVRFMQRKSSVFRSVG